MDKIFCAICGKELGVLSSKAQIANGVVCQECLHMAKHYREKEIEAHNEIIYEKATRTAQYIRSTEQMAAAQLFEQIAGWKDADEQAKKCRTLYEELLIEEAAAEKEKKRRSARKRRNKIILWLVLFGLFAYFFSNLNKPNSTAANTATTKATKAPTSSTENKNFAATATRSLTATPTVKHTATPTVKHTATPTAKPTATVIPAVQVKTRSTVSLRNSNGSALTQVTANTTLTLTSYAKNYDMFTTTYNGKTYYVKGTGLNTYQNNSWQSISKDELITYFGGKSTQLTTTPTSTPAASSGSYSSPYVVTVNSFVNEINSNKSKAAEKYNGKYVEITGTITYVSDAGSMVGYYIYGKRGESGLKITCWVNASSSTSKLKVGQRVSFRGLVREITTVNNTEIADCQIIK